MPEITQNMLKKHFTRHLNTMCNRNDKIVITLPAFNIKQTFMCDSLILFWIQIVLCVFDKVFFSFSFSLHRSHVYTYCTSFRFRHPQREHTLLTHANSGTYKYNVAAIYMPHSQNSAAQCCCACFFLSLTEIPYFEFLSSVLVSYSRWLRRRRFIIFLFVRARAFSLSLHMELRKKKRKKEFAGIYACECMFVCVCEAALTLSMAPLVYFQHMLRHDLTPFGRLVVHRKRFCRRCRLL